MNPVAAEENFVPTNPLLSGIQRVSRWVEQLKEEARKFFYAVILSAYVCPECGGSLQMIGPSSCQCRCGAQIDPTAMFQRSPCCGASLERKVLHYVCSSCYAVVPSRFLFDERLFDPQYYCEKMRESRQRKARKIEALKVLLAGSRSGSLWITDLPPLEAIPGFEMDLDGFVGSVSLMPLAAFLGGKAFNLEEYRRVILGHVPPGCIIRFSAIPPVLEDSRLDRARKFITLLFMEQSREALLTQENEEVKVEIYEADAEG